MSGGPFVAAPAKPPFVDEESKRIEAYLLQRVRAHLAAGVRSAPGSSRAEVHVVFVARGDKLSPESYVEPAREHPPVEARTA